MAAGWWVTVAGEKVRVKSAQVRQECREHVGTLEQSQL